jgi:hypothetical protein
MKHLRLLAFLLLTIVLTSQSYAMGGGAKRGVSLSGEDSLGIGVGLITSSQDNLNTVIDNANVGGGTVKNLGSGLEFFAQYAIRFDSSMWALVLRPSMMSQSASGNCQGGSCKYDVNGMAFFPMVRIIPLENSLIKFFLQMGLGYGQMEGHISQPAGSVKFKGSAFGAIGGLGVDFCLTESHCITVEGNLRYLPIERNLITSGSAAALAGGVTGNTSGDEIELNSKDLGTTMSGLQGMVSYTLMF